jgi:GT2 family glycosyltransferase
LGNDTELITRNWIELMLGFAQRKNTGAVGPKLIYPTETIQHAGLIIGITRYLGRSHYGFPRNSLGHGGQIQAIQNLSAIAAACMMMRRNVFEETGGFDSNFEVAHGDIDLCLKLRSKNYLIVYLPSVELYHYESFTWGHGNTSEKIERFIKENKLLMKKWGHILKKGDPYYNPNLEADIENFSMKM